MTSLNRYFIQYEKIDQFTKLWRILSYREYSWNPCTRERERAFAHHCLSSDRIIIKLWLTVSSLELQSVSLCYFSSFVDHNKLEFSHIKIIFHSSPPFPISFIFSALFPLPNWTAHVIGSAVVYFKFKCRIDDFFYICSKNL